MHSGNGLIARLRELGAGWLARGKAAYATLRRRFAHEPEAESEASAHPSGPRRKGHARAEKTRSGEGQFLQQSHAGPAGSRDYSLYLPSSYRGRPMPLIVMLHGCKQDPDDFARGTGMNDAAEEYGFLVAYPAQSQRANRMRCWQWFQAAHQMRGSGEPAIIAGIVREVSKHYAVDQKRVFIAGLSAGASMAVIMGMTYPELFAAVGVHSGLAYQGADNAYAALFAMRRGARPRLKNDGGIGRTGPPTIVFHGDVDRTVHPDNGMQVMRHSAPNSADGVPPEQAQMLVRRGRSDGGREYVRTAWLDAGQHPVAEHWLVQGLGHAWSGGRPEGSYTDPKGPSATREMLRFFLSRRAD
jgi:poly(hydroxyalkanoate) depolymerase family esterase